MSSVDQQKNLDRFKEYDLLTSTNEETVQISSELKTLGCCPRCILRFLGESNPHSYRCQTKDLESLFECGRNETSDTLGTCPCPVCLGILQSYAEKDFLIKAHTKVKEDGYSFTDYQCSLILPVCLFVREKALIIHLRKKFGVAYPGKQSALPSVKDVWKWSCGPSMTDLLDARFQNGSQFVILLTFDYPDSEKECSFLLDFDPETFKKRKQRKYGFETFTRANVSKALGEMGDSKFEDSFACPPGVPLKESTCTISCSHDAIFLAGRYLKFSRTLSQTPWIVDGKRIFEGSVEDFICDPMREMIKPSETRLSSSGREDVDVRMLGTGRPFVIELINPHCVKFSKQDIKDLQQRINDSTKDVQVRDLQLVERVDLASLKEGEIDKMKTYTAFCWCDRELNEEDLMYLSQMKELTIHQKTPIRVLHRRSALTRDRIIHSLKAEKLEDNRFKLNLQTQAGTYIKEFVHGDFGRTSPNLCEILKADCDILDLDVEAVDVDWPPYIDPLPGASDNLSQPMEDNPCALKEDIPCNLNEINPSDVRTENSNSTPAEVQKTAEISSTAKSNSSQMMDT